jgi:aryl-alcohol dehydrogenase-like predicted oxidoreductase
VKISEICLGGWMLGSKPDQEESINLIHRALDLGVNFIDTADRYGIVHSKVLHLSEMVICQALRGGNRDHVVVATKCRSQVGEGPNDDSAGLSCG